MVTYILNCIPKTVKKGTIFPEAFQAAIVTYIHRTSLASADTAQNFRAAVLERQGLGPQPSRWEERLGYPANSMNFKTEIFTYIKLLINIKFVFFYTF